MDYILSIFFNSKTNDLAMKKGIPDPGDWPPFANGNGKYFYSSWKWHWRHAEGPGWIETGDQVKAIKSEDAALAKVTVRVWNPDMTRTAMPNAYVIVSVSDPKDGTKKDAIAVFRKYKYKDISGPPTTKDFPRSGRGEFLLHDVAGGKESSADYGDQKMKSWDVIELHFADNPAKYNFEVALFVTFDSEKPEPMIFCLDPEMDIGILTE